MEGTMSSQKREICNVCVTDILQFVFRVLFRAFSG